MKIQVHVKSNSRKNHVELREDGSLFVSVNASPVEGKANKKVIELLAEYFHKPKSGIAIIAGKQSKRKIVEIS